MPATPAPAAFHFDALDTPYAVYLDPPAPSTAAPDTPLPVLVCLDGDDQFEAMRKARALLPKSSGAARLLLVGLGYGASYRSPANRRVRDYTPCPIEGAAQGGGAEPFIGMLQTDLWPALAQRFPLDEHTRGLAGHSLGALLALDALLRPAPFFNRILANAPSLWWGERALFTRLSARPTGPSAPAARLFLGIGLADSKSMGADLDDFERALAADPWPGLTVTQERFAHHDHFTAINPGFRTGLTALYD